VHEGTTSQPGRRTRRACIGKRIRDLIRRRTAKYAANVRRRSGNRQRAPSRYLLGFLHDTFYANGPVGWVEELMVNSTYRRRGGGRMLMVEFERWVSGRGGRIVALATRRASEFYQAVGYEESATYLRKVLLWK
jgi:GNAT superfamily N-acetyltransferase